MPTTPPDTSSESEGQPCRSDYQQLVHVPVSETDIVQMDAGDVTVIQYDEKDVGPVAVYLEERQQSPEQVDVDADLLVGLSALDVDRLRSPQFLRVGYDDRMYVLYHKSTEPPSATAVFDC